MRDNSAREVINGFYDFIYDDADYRNDANEGGKGFGQLRNMPADDIMNSLDLETSSTSPVP